MEVIVPCQAVRSFPHAASFFSSMLVCTIVVFVLFLVVVVVVLFLLLCCFAAFKNNCAVLKIMLDFYVLLLYIDIVAVL